MINFADGINQREYDATSLSDQRGGNKKLIETHSEQIPFKLFQNIEAKATLKPTTTTTSFVNIFFEMQKNGSKF